MPGLRRVASLPIICVVVAVAMAGCFGGGSDGSGDGTTDSPTSSPGTADPGTTGGPQVPPEEASYHGSFQDCRVSVMLVIVPYDQVQELLPPGFVPVGVAPGTADVNIRLFRCNSYVLDNETVVAPFIWAETSAYVAVNQTLQGNATGANLYMFEMFFREGEIGQRLDTIGFPVHTAEIVVDESTGHLQYEVLVAGATWYDVQTAMRPPQSTPQMGGVLRQHYLALPGQPMWLEVESTEEDSRSGAAAISATGGVFAELGSGPLGLLVANGGESSVSGTHSFDYLKLAPSVQ